MELIKELIKKLYISSVQFYFLVFVALQSKTGQFLHNIINIIISIV